MTQDKTNWKRFLDDGETCCFDCGKEDQDNNDFTKISHGVALCNTCLHNAREDYVKESSNE